MMEWIEPKTDWKYGEALNIEDYNRIKNNLLYLNDKCNIHFPPDVYVDLGADKVRTDNYYAEEFNAFEDLLESINQRAYQYDIGMKQTFNQLGKFIGFEEKNRIESACLRLYNMFLQIEEKTRRTAFRANGTDFEDSGENEWQS